MANGNKGKKVVKGGAKMSNKPDYEGTNFKNKAIDRLSQMAVGAAAGAVAGAAVGKAGGRQLMKTIRPRTPQGQLRRTIQPMGAVGKGGSRNR